MIFHENRLLADNSYEISYFFHKLGQMSQKLSSAAVVIGALKKGAATLMITMFYMKDLNKP